MIKRILPFSENLIFYIANIIFNIIIFKRMNRKKYDFAVAECLNK